MAISERTLELTRRFYEWERRGRGWDLYDSPVALEPPLVFPDWHGGKEPSRDDTRRPHWLKHLLTRRPQSGEQPEPEEPTPATFQWGPDSPVEYSILVPEGVKIAPERSLAWIESLRLAEAPVAFELLGYAGRVEMRLACGEADAHLVQNTLQATAPELLVRSSTQRLSRLWQEAPGDRRATVEFGLGREFVIPLSAHTQRGLDVLSLLAAHLQEVGQDGMGIVQVLFTRTAAAWSEVIPRALITPSGKPFFADAPEVSKHAYEKISSPLFAACVRLAIKGSSPERNYSGLRMLTSSLMRLGSPTRNELIPLSSGDPDDLLADVLGRTTHRTGMILSADELSGLVRLPENSQLPGLAHLTTGKRAPASPTDGVLLGENIIGAEKASVRLGTPDRLRHVHIVGASGTGKSTLLVRLILQDIEAGRGVAVLDPHGDLVDEVLSRLPEAWVNKAIIFDPSDESHVVGWNILEAASEIERQILASDLVGVFRRLATSWGDQMTSVLANAILTFLDSPRGGTLLDLRRFLVDAKYRADYVKTIRDPHLASFWQVEFPMLVGKRPQTPILTRLDTLLRSRLVRGVVTATERPLDFRSIMDEGHLFLARLSQGAIGRENAALLGSLLVSRFQQVALSRQDTPLSERRAFFLYADEFHEIATPSMATLFSGIRKYGLGMTVAHQSLYSLRSSQPEVERAVLDNAHTRIVFRVGDDDARRLASGFSSFGPEELTRLQTGEAICRIGGSSNDFNLSTNQLSSTDPTKAGSHREKVLAESRKRWAVLRPKLAVKVDRLAVPTSIQGEPTAGTSEHEPVSYQAPAVKRPPDGQVKRAAEETTADPHPEGRGGPEHRYLQSLIREWAQGRGLKVDLEVELEAGGRVDLVIERADERIACEVSVTTGLEHEIRNVQKCLEAKFETVFVVSLKRSFLQSLSAALDKALSTKERTRVRVAAPEDLLAWLEDEPAREDTIAGYAVRTQVRSADAVEAGARRKRLAEVIGKSVRRINKKGA